MIYKYFFNFCRSITWLNPLEFKLIVLKQMIGKNDSNLNLKITFRPAGLPFKVKRVTNCEI